MAKVCDICGKRPMFGNRVSHAKNRTNRRWYPNLHKVRVMVDGTPKRLSVCTQCLRSGRVKKAIQQPAKPSESV